MKYIGKPIDTEKYFLYDIFSRENGIFQYRARVPQNEEERKNHNTFFFKRNKWSTYLHIGELVGKILADKSNFRACDVELYKARLSSSDGAEHFDYGVISYVEQSKDDDIILPRTIMEQYLKEKNLNRKHSWVYDVDTVMDAMFFELSKRNRPYQEFLDFKQDFINMLIFDLKFMNADRSQENWHIRKNKKTGQYDLYPMFDNAAILGFEDEKDSENISEEALEKIDTEHVCSIVTIKEIEAEEEKAEYKQVLKHLLKKYPVQTESALKATSAVTKEYLEEVLEEIEEITPKRKNFTIKLFEKRDKEINRIYKEYLEQKVFLL